MRRRRFFIFMPFIFLFLFGIYLYAANAYIYHRIKQGNLPFTDTQGTYELGAQRGLKRTYVALGDSLTFGVGAQTYERSYPYLLAQKLAEKAPIELKDLSYPGYQSADLITQFLPRAIASDPDIVTILIGTNDLHNWVSKKQFEEQYRTILDELTRKTHAKIFAISVPFIGSDTLYLPPLHAYFDWKTEAYNDIIRSLAAEYGITYIDIATPTRALFVHDGPVYAADSFHPSAAGYKAWADILYAHIDR